MARCAAGPFVYERRRQHAFIAAGTHSAISQRRFPMLKLALTALLVAGLAVPLPASAESNSGIGRGCTLDPFTKTMRCIDFDNCTIDKNGKKTCPVVVTPYGRKAAFATAG
jgi:hypothetical protein